MIVSCGGCGATKKKKSGTEGTMGCLSYEGVVVNDVSGSKRHVAKRKREEKGR